MTDKKFPSVRIMNFQHDCALIEGHFRITPGAPGVLVANSRFGNGWSMAVTGTGRYTITTDDDYNHVVACQAEFSPTTVTDRFIAAGVPGGGAGAPITWEIDIWDIGGAGVVTPAVNTDEIHFWMILSTSGNDRAAW